MILVNGEAFDWEDGMTVAEMLRRKNYTHPAIVVLINGTPIPEDDFEIVRINDGDDVKALHLVAGG